jgi:hypothetical protein
MKYRCQGVNRFGNNQVAVNANGTMEEAIEVGEPVEKKFKIFGWRLFHGLIPCRTILPNKHIPTLEDAPACHVKVSSI